MPRRPLGMRALRANVRQRRALNPALTRFFELGIRPSRSIDRSEFDGAAYLLTLGGAREDKLHAMWAAHRHTIIECWIRHRPGTRPFMWWSIDAPRWPRHALPARLRDLSEGTLRRLCEPRRRIGGTGDPAFECLAYCPRLAHGVPVDWCSPGFRGRAPLPHDPPVFESQAAYLQRHGLLTVDEARRLTPADFEPEVLNLFSEDASR